MVSVPVIRSDINLPYTMNGNAPFLGFINDAKMDTEGFSRNQNSFLTAKKIELQNNKQRPAKALQVTSVDDDIRRLSPPNGGVMKSTENFTNLPMTEIVNYADKTKEKPWYQEWYQVVPQPKTGLLKIKLFVTKENRVQSGVIHEVVFNVNGKLDTRNPQNVKIITKNGVFSLNKLAWEKMLVQIEQDRIDHNAKCEEYFIIPFINLKVSSGPSPGCIIDPD